MTVGEHGGRQLTRVPLRASFEWIDKTVTTDPPRYAPHTEWSLAVRVTAPTRLRAVVLVICAGETSWGLVDAAPSTDLGLRVAFSPHDWSTSDVVHVSFEWQRAAVTDARLKEDPRNAVEVGLPPRPSSGEPIPVVELAAHDVELAVLVLAEQDTESRRMDRWRIKPEFATGLPEDLVPLASGHQHGVIPPR
jgi:hypothetical protein